jgi:hypothetical protein
VLVAVAAVFLLACGDGDDTPSEPTVPPTATQVVAPTATRTVEEEVGDAYLRYWEAYGEALLELDPTLAEGVAAGEELERIREEIETLRSQGVALRTVVEHNFVVVEASPDSASLVDELTNNSFYVDPETKQPSQASGSGEVLRDTFFFEKVGGRWVVVRSSRQN